MPTGVIFHLGILGVMAHRPTYKLRLDHTGIQQHTISCELDRGETTSSDRF